MIKELYEIVRDYLSGEIGKIRSLERDKRGEYIFEYHKWKLIILTMVIVLSTAITVSAVNRRDTVFSLALVNQTVSLDADAEKDAELAKVLGINENKSCVNVDSSYQIVWKEGNNDYTDYEKFFLNVSNGVIDCAVVPEEFADYCFSLEEFAVPNNELNINIPKNRQYIYNGTPCGIYTDGTEFSDETKDDRYVAFFPNTGKNRENAEKFAQYLIGVINDAS